MDTEKNFWKASKCKVHYSKTADRFERLEAQNEALYAQLLKLKEQASQKRLPAEEKHHHYFLFFPDLRKWVAWATESKDFLIFLTLLLASLALIYYKFDDYQRYKKDHKFMILLKAYMPEEAKQAIFHLETDSLRECFLPQAINILDERDSIETATKQAEVQEPAEQKTASLV